MPFEMTPDPAFLYMTDQHREALAAIAYAIAARKGFVVIVGDAGTGKTTVLTGALQYFATERLQSSVVLNPTLTRTEFLEMVLLDFGIKEIPPTKPQRLLKLAELLEAGRRAGKASVLVVDEAHLLAPELLEEIRLLGNFERSNEKLLQIVLAGQLPLAQILNREDLAQLKQRTAVRLTIKPLAADEVPGYLKFRWTHAGGKELPFSSAAVEEVARRSRGFPRLINSICDSALVLAFAEMSEAVSKEHVDQACLDLDMAEIETERLPQRTPGTATLQAATVNGHSKIHRESSDAAVDPSHAQDHANAGGGTIAATAGKPSDSQEIPEPPPEPLMKTLERYAAKPTREQFLARWAAKLGLAG